MKHMIAASVFALASGALIHASELHAAQVYSSKIAFLSLPGQRLGATFEDAPTGQLGPFSSGGIQFPTNSMQVTSNLVVTHPFFFGVEGSPPNFAVVSTPTNEVRAVFGADVVGSGFDLNCFGCDVSQNSSALEWSTYGAKGNLIESGTVVVDFSGPSSVKFFGLTSTQPFRSLHVTRRSIPAGAFATWVIDDVRVIAAPDAAIEVPTTGPGVLVTTALLLIAAGLNYRRGA